MRLPPMAALQRAAKIGLVCALVSGCAGFNRSCSSFNAQNFGADWIVAQYDMNGHPYNCWKLTNVSVANEEGSDGIHWAEGTLGHLVHISGWYDRVQVQGGDFAGAAQLVGVDVNQCGNGHYPAYVPIPPVAAPGTPNVFGPSPLGAPVPKA